MRKVIVVLIGFFVVAALGQESLQSENRADSSALPVGIPIDLYPINQIPISDTIKIPVLDFKNTDIRDVLRALGMQYNVNIYIEPEVSGPLSLYLTEMPVKQALDFVIKRSRFAYMVENGIVKVYLPTVAPPPPPPVPKAIFHLVNGLLDIDITNVPASDVARMFTDSVKINVVLDAKNADPKATISSRLTGLKPEKAVKALFEPNGYDVALQEGLYYVTRQAWGGDALGNQRQTTLKRLAITIVKERVNVEVDDAPLDQVIRTISVQSGINVIIYDKITGTITAKFDSVAIDDAMRFLLQNTKFTFWKDRGIYFVGSREMSQQKTSLVIPLAHIMADETVISKMLPPHITQSAVLKYDKEHNTVIVIGSYDDIAQAQEYIEKIDKPVPQVLIEALVVDFNINKIRDFGLSLFTQGAGDSTGNWNSEKFLPTLDLKPGINKTQATLNSITGALKNVLGTMGLNEVINLPKNFRANIRLLESADVVKVHSTPQIATISGNTASITIGETRFYKLNKETRTGTANVDNNIIGTDQRFEKMQFDTKLQVTPWVMDQGYVMVEIKPEFQIPRSGGDPSLPPTTDNRVIESMVRLRNGQSIVLGGQRQTGEVVNREGIPFLSDIPILGFLFSRRTIQSNETQMMIFLTPRVYYGDEGEVKPDDFFGKEVNKMLDDVDPARVAEKRKIRHEKRAVWWRGVKKKFNSRFGKKPKENVIGAQNATPLQKEDNVAKSK